MTIPTTYINPYQCTDNGPMEKAIGLILIVTIVFPVNQHNHILIIYGGPRKVSILGGYQPEGLRVNVMYESSVKYLKQVMGKPGLNIPLHPEMLRSYSLRSYRDGSPQHDKYTIMPEIQLDSISSILDCRVEHPRGTRYPIRCRGLKAMINGTSLQ